MYLQSLEILKQNGTLLVQSGALLCRQGPAAEGVTPGSQNLLAVGMDLLLSVIGSSLPAKCGGEK